MNIISTTNLNERQEREILGLQALCNSFEGLHTETLLTNKFNLDKQLPCFFLGYDDACTADGGTVLVSFLYLFFAEPSTIEIIAFTSPDSRKRGWFSRLYQAAFPHLKSSSVHKVLFQIEPISESGMATLHKTFPHATLSHSEYQLSCTALPPEEVGSVELVEVTQQNKEIAIHLAIETFQSVEAAERSHIDAILGEDGNDAFIAYDGEVPVGVCNRVLEKDTAGLFGLGIRPSLQRMGYGKKLLASMLRKTLSERPRTTLEVDSNNPPALNLYLHNGFSIGFQMDYHAVPIA